MAYKQNNFNIKSFWLYFLVNNSSENSNHSIVSIQLPAYDLMYNDNYEYLLFKNKSISHSVFTLYKVKTQKSVILCHLPVTFLHHKALHFSYISPCSAKISCHEQLNFHTARITVVLCTFPCLKIY
jgi:hypothetical protein